MKLFYRSFIVVLFAVCSSAYGQTFSGTGGLIPDNGNSIDFIIPVTGLPNSIDTVSFGVETICIDLTHTWDSDLDISLMAPDGTSVLLTSGNGGSDDDYTNTCFNYFATTSITQGSAPFTGTYRPQGQLGIVNNGQDPNGLWKLHILDTYPFADQGTLLSWSITFGNTPALAWMLQSSNLPIIKINTSGQGIPDEPKITADMKIIYNGPGVINYISDSANNYNGKIGIEIRGHSSQMFPQKQFGFETRDSSGNNLNASLLGMPAENDWILYAPYNDKSNIRNSLTYFLCNAMGRYASRCMFSEVIIDNEYKGIYVLMEKIKRDSARVDIDNLLPTDTAGSELTGGYICSIDWADNDGWYSNYPPDPTNPQNNTVYYQYVFPNDSAITAAQKTYIQQYVDSFEAALSGINYQDTVTGWRRYADENSFIDYLLINEISKNVDGYRLSSYFYKDKDANGGKINAGPAWDFNLAWHNADYCGNDLPGEWAYQFTDYCQWDFPFWWRRLMTDSVFQNRLHCRWMQLRSTVLDTPYIFSYIDSMQKYLGDAQQRHFNTWPILGVYVWPNPSPLAQTYEEELDNLKAWITSRIAFLDSNMPGTCLTTGNHEITAPGEFTLYPNPANRTAVISWAGKENEKAVQIAIGIKIADVMGKEVFLSSVTDSQVEVDVSNFENGIYFVELSVDGEVFRKKFIKE